MNASLTASNESLRLQAYDDRDGTPLDVGYTLKGNATVGWGICISKPFGGLEADEADVLILYRLWGIHRALDLRFANWDALSQTRRAVLADVAFNRGLSLFDMMGGLKTAVESEDWVLTAHIIASCPAAKVDTKRYALLQSYMVTDAALGPNYPIPDISTRFKQFMQECS